MKRISKFFLILLLCMSIVIQGVPSVAKDEEDINEPTYKVKYKVEKLSHHFALLLTAARMRILRILSGMLEPKPE